MMMSYLEQAKTILKGLTLKEKIGQHYSKRLNQALLRPPM